MQHALERLKPASWAMDPLRTPAETLQLWDALHLALPLWDGGGKFAEDFSGLNLHSGAWNSGLSWTRGELGMGLDFDGTTSANFQIPDPPADWLDGCGQFAVELWFELDSVTGIHGLIGKYRAATGYRSWRIYTDGTEIRIQASSNGTAYEEKVTSGAGLATGTLYHLIVQFNAGTLTMYLNGVSLTVSGNFSFSTIYGGTDYVLVGKRYDGYYLDGRVYSIRFWQRALLAEERSILFETPFRMYEKDFSLPSWALLHAGSTPAGQWELAGTVEKDTEELYIPGLQNGVSYDIFIKTVDQTGNQSAGCIPQSVTPAGSTGGVYAPLRHGISVAPVVPVIHRRYR